MRPRALLLVAVSGVIAAAILDVVAPASPGVPEGVRMDPATGAVACPFGTIGAAPAFVHLANVAEEPAQVRVLVASDRGENVLLNADLDALSTRTVRVSGRVKGNAAIFVDHAGGKVVASHSVWSSSRSSRGVAAGVCARAGDARIVLPHGSTGVLGSTIAVANPGTADADVTISLLREGQRVTPESLTRRVVPARSRRLYRLSDFVFDSADVTAILEVSAGRVVAEMSLGYASGLSFLGASAPGRTVVQPLDATGDARVLSIAAIGEDEEAGLDARALRPDEQGRAPGVPPAIAPSSSVRLNVPSRLGDDALAYALSVAAGSPISTAGSWRRTTRGGTDRATIEGMAPARRWAMVLAPVQASAETRALLVNDGAEPVQVTLTILGGDEPRTIEVVVPAGRIVTQRLGRGQGTFAAHAIADGPIVVAAVMNLGAPRHAVAGVPGVVLDPPSEVAVIRDARIGVPARVPEDDG